MNTLISKTAIYTFCFIFISLFSIFGQDSTLKEIIISPRVGTVIDQEEREKFELFKDVDSFQSAQVYRMPDGGIQIQIKYINPETGNEQIQKWYPTNSEILRMQESIDHYEEIKRGAYTYQSQPKSVKAVPNFEIQDSLVTVEINDGSNFIGSIMKQDESKIYFKTINGIEATIPKSVITKIKPMEGKIVEGTYLRLDPNYSRLLFAPTGRPLKKGEGYFSDYYVFFPGISYGFTNNITLMAGFSFLPGASFSEQLKYIAPKIGVNLNDKFAIATGALYMGAEDVAAGIGFLVGTYGERDHCFTLGLGLGYTKEEDEDLKFAEHPIIMFGGNARLSNSVALISENWLITGSDFDITQQPFSIGVRFFGDHVSADVALVIIVDVIEDGFPIPWLSFIYNFGN
jgi:hypothetical protein